MVELNKSLFKSRLEKVYNGWNGATENDEYASVANAEALLLVAGDPASEDEPTRKGISFQQWLLGYEFPSTLILFHKDKVSILCSASKGKILSQVKGISSIVPVEIHAQAKPKDAPTDALPKFLKQYTSYARVGGLPKEAHTGKLVTEWEKSVSGASTQPEVVDMSHAISAFMAVKDTEELKIIQTAAALSSTLLQGYVAPKLESILDKEAKLSHDAFSSLIESRLGSGEGDSAKGPDMKVWGKGKGLSDVDWPLVEISYPPIIISRSTKTGYDLKYTAESTDDPIAHKGVLLIAFGIRYKSYNVNVGRTFIVDPNPEQEAQYNLLLSLQESILSGLKAGAIARDVYQHALSFVKDKKPELQNKFVKNIGFGMGTEFRDAAYLLSPKNARVIKANMVFNLSLGFSDLQDSHGASYALHLLDTVKVEENRSVVLTHGIKSVKDTLFFQTPDSDAEKPKKRKPPVAPRTNGSPVKQKTVAGKVLRNQTRSSKDEMHQTNAAKMLEHQKELHDRLQSEGLEKYSEEGGSSNNKEGKGWKKFQSYKGEAALPSEVDRLRIHVDKKAQTVILPVHGYAVPFHINTIKNTNKSDEGNYTYLRINFQTPGQLAGKKEDTPFEDPDATFVRSVTYRSQDGHRFDAIVKSITELKKEVTKREQQKKEMADVVEQGKLIEVKGRRPQKLSEVFVRPALDGKRLPGEVEIHTNGVRYQSPLGSQKIDVLFSNVKHLFFQPCDKELIALVHLHLKAPIIVGKKKTFDVQFFREATDVQFDETGNRKRKSRYGDEDEIEMEQQERKRRQMLNKEMRSFGEKISEAASAVSDDNLDLDIPFQELAFDGVPFRAGVRLQPTTECLVHLTDPPFLVVTLAEIEIASLERVQYILKQFDMVLVFKDFTKTPLHINSIQTTQLDDVKNWLDSVDIPMSEGPVNLNWGPIMKTINESPYEFFQQGGWGFLGGAGGDASDGSGGSDSESDFEADPEDFDEPESSDDGSDFGSDGSGSDVSGSDFGGGDSDESEEGDDWDELERKAARSDQKRGDGTKKADSDDSDDDKHKKKKSSKSNGKSNGKSRR